MSKGFQNKANGFRQTAFRYGIALASFIVTIGITLLFLHYSIKLNLAILVLMALIIPSWFGGRGPGFLVTFLLLVATILIGGKPDDIPLVNFIFSLFSSALICLVVVLLVSSRRNFEVNLREQRELWKVTLSSIADAVIATDTEGKITFINPMAENLTGWTKKEAKGKLLTDVFKIVDEITREPVENQVLKVLREESAVELDYEVILLAEDGKEIPIVESYAPIRAEDGTIIGVILAFHNISERKQLVENERRLQQSQKMEAIGTLTGGVAHDFNNLLTAILGNSQLALLRTRSDDPIQRNLKEVEEAGKRAAVLTKQLLVFSRRQHLERRIVNLNTSVAEISKLLNRIIGEDVEITTRYADDLSTVLADPGQIEQVVMNLAVNARDAMPGGGRLTIETGNIELDESYCTRYPYVTPGSYVQISVSDTGTGMDKETQAHIFEPFFTTKDVGKGTGLGLSMAYGIVTQHGGNINVYSELGHGTTFKVFLPVVVEDAVEEAEEVISPTMEGGMETILIAEDEEILRNLAIDVLEGFGYSLLIAQNGQEAVEIYTENRWRIDLLLFDVVMPVMGGPEAYEKIRELSPDSAPPVIFMTGYSSELIESRVVKPGTLIDSPASAVIQKPYSIEGLGRTIREALDSKHLGLQK